MAREVNLKALVSHVVKGDGIDKCRICMGDTSEGQVYLGDTVIMDGDKPVTLSELLEAITGVEVQLEEEMPASLCSACSTSVLNAAHFRTFCRQSTEQWRTSVQLLDNLRSLPINKSNKAILIIGTNEMTIIDKYPGLDKMKSVGENVLTKGTSKVKSRREGRTFMGCQCADCGKKFKYPQQLHQHLKESINLKRACHICAKIMTRDELVTHMKDVHGRKPYDCKKCPALLHSYSQYKRHVVKAHSRGSFFCGDCGRTFQSPQAFHAHQSIHTSKTCPGCDMLFVNQTCYLYHVKKCCNLDGNREDTHRTKHKVFVEVENRISDRKVKVGLRGSADQECVCDYCGKKFAGKKFVSAHIQIVHMKNTHRPCAYCGKQLAAAHMTEHVKKHEIVRKFTCEHCGVVLRTKLGYVQHLRLHTGEKPYKCQYCGETFSASSRKSEHIRRTHKSSENELRHACELCPARFRLPYQLKKHIITVHDPDSEDPTSLQFECDECHEKFASYRGLLHHGRKHQEQFIMNRKVKRDSKFKVCSTEHDKQKAIEEVCEDTGLPRGTCRECYQAAVVAYHLTKLVKESSRQWSFASCMLRQVQNPTYKGTACYIHYCDNTLLLQDREKEITDISEEIKTLSSALDTQCTVVPLVKKKPRPRLHKAIKCCDCNQKFHSPNTLNRHLKSSIKCVCTRCLVIVRKAKLAKHLWRVHQIKVYSCNSCHQIFKEDKDLIKHTELYHGPDSHHCEMCGAGFRIARALRTHSSVHTLFSCASCSASFENQKCYKYHKTQCKEHKYQPTSLYECHDCGIKYLKKTSLKVHIVQKHLRVLPFVCQVCGKRSSNVSHAKAHEAIHTTERKTFQCFCGAEMRTITGYNLHKRIHTGEKPYECDRCDQRFISASRRLDHMKRRHGSARDMKHGCDNCNARFLRPGELKKHKLHCQGDD